MRVRPVFARMHGPNLPVAVITTADSPLARGRWVSSAEIARALQHYGVPVVTPPSASNNVPQSWSYPDTAEGIAAALGAGAQVLFLNTDVHAAHPIVKHLAGVGIVGQDPFTVRRLEDKWLMRNPTAACGAKAPVAVLYDPAAARAVTTALAKAHLAPPLVIKPRSGKRSALVTCVTTTVALQTTLSTLPPTDEYIIEQFVPGIEASLTVLPPGWYRVNGRPLRRRQSWYLPVLERTGHDNGIAPPGATEQERPLPEGRTAALRRDCQRLADHCAIRFPIRIDARQGADQHWYILDVNTKPNLGGHTFTGVSLAMRGWPYEEFLWSIYRHAWRAIP